MLVVSRTTSDWTSKIWIKHQPHGTLPFSSSPMHFWRCSFSSWIAFTGMPVRIDLKFWATILLLRKQCPVLFQFVLLRWGCVRSTNARALLLPSIFIRISEIFNRLSAKSSTEWFGNLKRDLYLSISWRRHVNQIHSRTIHMNIGTLRRRAFMREARWL